MRLSHTMLLASLNRHKFEEFSALLAHYPGIELEPAQRYLRNPEGLKFSERHETYLENAIAKARLVNQGSHYPALGDDSGLEVDALGGRPGVRSHRYATPTPGVSQDQANIELLLSELKGKAQRSAQFVCTLALNIEGVLLTGTGSLEGTILEQPRGNQGFGYDPIFLPRNSDRSLAELSASEKNQISHRARALQDLMRKVKEHGIVLVKP